MSLLQQGKNCSRHPSEGWGPVEYVEEEFGLASQKLRFSFAELPFPALAGLTCKVVCCTRKIYSKAFTETKT